MSTAPSGVLTTMHFWITLVWAQRSHQRSILAEASSVIFWTGSSGKNKNKPTFVNSYTAGGEEGQVTKSLQRDHRSIRNLRENFISLQILMYPCPRGCTKPHAEEGKGGVLLQFLFFLFGVVDWSTTPPPSSSICATPCNPYLSGLTGHALRGNPKRGIYRGPRQVNRTKK